MHNADLGAQGFILLVQIASEVHFRAQPLDLLEISTLLISGASNVVDCCTKLANA